MVYCQCRGADVKWVYSPSVDVYYLMGEGKQYAHIVVAAGLVHWACLSSTDPPTKFYNLDEAKAYTIAMVRLS